MRFAFLRRGRAVRAVLVATLAVLGAAATFVGHYTCSAVPWVSGLVSLTDPFLLQESFHPLPIGHQAMYRIVRDSVKAAGL